MSKSLSTKEAAEKLDVSVRRVRQYIENGQLKAQKIGRDHVIEESELAKISVNKKAGRPPKKKD